MKLLADFQIYINVPLKTINWSCENTFAWKYRQGSYYKRKNLFKFSYYQAQIKSRGFSSRIQNNQISFFFERKSCWKYVFGYFQLLIQKHV